MKFRHAVVFATALSLAPFTAFAGKKAAPPAPKPFIPTLSQVFEASGINVTGVVDMSYDLSKNDVTGIPAAAATTFRAFDVHPNSFVFHQLYLTISKQWSNGISLVVNPIFGDDANRLQGTRGQPTVAGGGALGNSDWVLNQAYLQYSIGNLTLMGGKFVTLSSAEIINPAGNINASRSLLFTNFTPLTHVGVRGSYMLCKNLTLTVGGVNTGAGTAFGTSPLVSGRYSVAAGSPGNGNTDNNSNVSLESQLAYTGGIFSTAFTYYHGDEATPAFPFGATLGDDDRQIDLYDFVASVTPMDALTLGLNFDYIVADTGTAEGAGSAGTFDGAAATGGQTYDSGIAGYVNFKLTPKARVAVRGEYLSIDANTGGPTLNTGYVYVNEFTVTFAYAPLSGLELLAEVRQDNADNPIFTTVRGPAGIAVGGSIAGASSYQQTGTLKAIYKF